MSHDGIPGLATRLFGIDVTRRQVLARLGAASVAGMAGSRLARAQAGGQIVVYSTTLPDIQARVAEAFTNTTGIAVQSLRLTTSPLAQRFLAEQEAGQYLCDVVTLGNEIFFSEISEKGFLAPIDDIPGVASLPDGWRAGERYVQIMVAPQSMAYNTNLVAADQVPTAWADLLKPEFSGQILMADPRANETILSFLDMLHEALGDDFVRGLGAQNPRLVPSVPQGVEQVIAGDAMIIIPCLAMNLLKYEGTGAPITFTPTPTPTNGTYFFSGVAANAPNPEGARLWYEFLLSPEGQEILCKDNGISPLGDIPHSLKAPEQFVERDFQDSLNKAELLYDLLGLAG